MKEQRQHQHPKPEIVGNYRVVYPIFREDLAEAVLTPLASQSPAAGPPIAKKWDEIEQRFLNGWMNREFTHWLENHPKDTPKKEDEPK